MKKIFNMAAIASCMLVTALFMACSSEGTNENNTNNHPTGTTQFEFGITEKPYNADVDLTTRSSESMPESRFVDLGGGIEAEVAIKRDIESAPAQTRAIESNLHYTIVVFKAGTTDQVVEFKGRFDKTQARFVPDAGTPSFFQVETGAFYDFICYTDAYGTRIGNKVKFFAKDADKAFFCSLKNVKAENTARQQLNFAMEHIGVRVRTKIAAYAKIPADVKAKIISDAANIFGDCELDMATGTFSGGTREVLPVIEQNYTETGTYNEGSETFNTIAATEYAYYLVGLAPNSLQLQFTAGRVYDRNLSGGARHLQGTASMLPGGSYTVHIKLLPKFKYLFHNGEEGFRSDAARANDTPIAVYVGKDAKTGKKMAVCLWDMNNVQLFKDLDGGPAEQENDTAPFTSLSDAVKDDESGFRWTWDGTALANSDGQPKATKEIVYTYGLRFNVYPAFRYAAYVWQDTYVFPPHLKPGQTLNEKVKGDNKWFLPSISSWAKVFTHLGIGDIDDLTALGEYPWREALVNAVFTSAGGVPPTTGKEYWSSSEYGDGKSAFYFSAKNGKAKFATIYKTDPMTLYENTMHIRPFIIY